MAGTPTSRETRVKALEEERCRSRLRRGRPNDDDAVRRRLRRTALLLDDQALQRIPQRRVRPRDELLPEGVAEVLRADPRPAYAASNGRFCSQLRARASGSTGTFTTVMRSGAPAPASASAARDRRAGRRCPTNRRRARRSACPSAGPPSRPCTVSSTKARSAAPLTRGASELGLQHVALVSARRRSSSRRLRSVLPSPCDASATPTRMPITSAKKTATSDATW